ncbi:MAG: sugar phosphate isomerase/epimerase [Hyphomicrobiaceae bacterium]
MSRAYSLAYLTAADLLPADMIRLAARLGYSNVGIRILPVAPGADFAPLIEQPERLRETQAAMQDTGVTVFDVEIVRIGAAFKTSDYARFLETIASLNARAILVAGDDTDEARLTASFAKFCEAARQYNITADLEPMPWTEVPNVPTAHRIVKNAAQPNGGVLIDALHYARSKSTLTDVAAIPRQHLHYAQICDASAEIPNTTEGLIHTARNARLLPGDGGIDLRGLFATLPSDIPVSIEIPNNVERARLGNEEWARRALAAAKRIIEGVV